MTSIEALVASADHWDAIADAQEEAARTYARADGDVSCYYYRARTYRKSAEALRREARTGKPHCSNCGGPHANHEHGAKYDVTACRCGAETCPWCMR